MKSLSVGTVFFLLSLFLPGTLFGQQLFSPYPLTYTTPGEISPENKKNEGEKSQRPELEEKENGEEREEPEEEEALETERDAFTPRTKTLEKGIFAFETAYSFIDSKEGKDKHSYPEILLRYGLTDWMEVRLGWNLEQGGGEVTTTGAFLGGGEQTLLYGAKFSLTQQQGWFPESAFLLQGHTPTGGEANDSKFDLGYVVGWKLRNNWKLDSALRYLTDSEEEDHFYTWAPSVVLRVPVSNRVTTHIEYFGLFTTQKEQNTNRQFLSGGMAFNPISDMEIGVRLGVGLNDQSANFFVNAGIGFRF